MPMRSSVLPSKSRHAIPLRNAAMSLFRSTLLRAGLLASVLSFGPGAGFAEAPTADIRTGMQTPPTDQRLALVIGNSNYQSAPRLANPGNDAQSMSQLLNSAGFEVTR